jgi:hypothetical protein
MIVSLWKITTDHEGESTITLKAPASELPNVLQLNLLLQRELEADFKEKEYEHRAEGEIA